MKRLIFNTLLLMMISVFGQAQSFQVSSVTGSAYILSNGESKSLSPRDILSGKDIIRIDENSSISVIDKTANKIYALKSQEEAPIVDIIASQSNSAIGRFVDNFIRALTRGDTEKISHEATVVYKDINNDLKLYSAIKSKSYASSYGVSLSLVNVETGKEIGSSANIGDEFFFRVTNNATIPLFVNVLNISSDGTLYDCLPIDEGGTMLHLLIPAQSTIDLRHYPMEFGLPHGTDTMSLIASEAPFDIRNIIKMYEKSEPTLTPKPGVGIFSLNINTK